jgi:hypothetical protein
MRLTDIWGNPVSCASAAAVRRLEKAISLFNAYQADPLAEIDGVLAEHPDFVMAHAFRAGMLATAGDRAFEGELRRSVIAAEALVAKANDRERLHIAAARAWLDGDIERAAESWGRSALLYPRDLPAIQLAHITDFFLGYSTMLRDRVARVLPYWDRTIANYGFVLGMHAFGLEESGDYVQAEAVGRQAFSLNGQDGWAAHAVAHVMEMQGRAADGVDWLETTAPAWGPGSLFAFHNWWHLALFRLDTGDAKAALKLFDEKVAAGGFGQALELIDGTGMLWRLSTLGHDIGDRWKDIADKWAQRIDHGVLAFNDMHAMMAFVGTNRREEQSALLATAWRASG